MSEGKSPGESLFEAQKLAFDPGWESLAGGHRYHFEAKAGRQLAAELASAQSEIAALAHDMERALKREATLRADNERLVRSIRFAWESLDADNDSSDAERTLRHALEPVAKANLPQGER